MVRNQLKKHTTVLSLENTSPFGAPFNRVHVGPLLPRYTAVVIEAARLFLKFAVDQWNQTTNQCASSEAPVNSTRTLHAAVWPNVRVTAKFNNTNQMTKKLVFLLNT